MVTREELRVLAPGQKLRLQLISSDHHDGDYIQEHLMGATMLVELVKIDSGLVCAEDIIPRPRRHPGMTMPDPIRRALVVKHLSGIWPPELSMERHVQGALLMIPDALLEKVTVVK